MTSGKVLFIIAHEGFQPTEYREPKKVLQDAGFTIVTASDAAGHATDADGQTVPVDLTLNHVRVKEYDGIIFIGGPGALEHLDNAASYTIIKAAMDRHMPLGAICIAPRILAKAGALTRKRATGWNGDNQLEEFFKTYDVIYLPEPVVVMDQVVTASGPQAAKLFGQEMLALLHNNKGWG